MQLYRMKTPTNYFFTCAVVSAVVITLGRAQESGGPANDTVQDVVSVSFLKESESDILVSWDPLVSTSSTNITGYRVYYSRVAVGKRTSQLLDEGQAEQYVDVSGRLTTSRVITGLVKDATYQFQVIGIVDGQEPDGERIHVALDDFDILIATVNDRDECVPRKLYIKTSQAIGGILAAIFCTLIAYSLVLFMVCCCYSLSHRSVKMLKREVLRCDVLPDYQTQDDFGDGDTPEKPDGGDSNNMVTNPAFDTSVDRYIDDGLNQDALSPVPTENMSKTT